MRLRSRTPAAVLAVAALALPSGCAGPTSDVSDYRHKAANTAEALVSHVQTAILNGQLVLDDKVPLRYAAVSVSQVEEDASSVQQTFDSRQPPDSAAADELRDRLDTAIEDATGAITDMRIAIRRGSDSDIHDALDELSEALPPLQRLEDIA